MTHPRNAGPVPIPDPEAYAQAVRAVVSDEEANRILEGYAEEGWFGVNTDLEPITLAVLAVHAPFAEWYVRRYPERAATVVEIRGMAVEEALLEIRKGRWVEHLRFD